MLSVCQYIPFPLIISECLNQYISWHLSLSQRRTSYIPFTSLYVYMCIPLSLVGNGSIKTLPLQWIHMQQNNRLTCRFLFSMCSVSQESRRSVLSRTCFFFIPYFSPQTKKTNSVVLVRKRTIPTERPQPVGEVSANFCW
jgi:hypothetical protein